MNTVALRDTEENDVLLLTPVDVKDSVPYEIADYHYIGHLPTFM